MEFPRLWRVKGERQDTASTFRQLIQASAARVLPETYPLPLDRRNVSSSSEIATGMKRGARAC